MIRNSFIILSFVFLLNGCLLKDYRYDFNQLNDEVISAEIVTVEYLKNGETQVDVIHKINDDQLKNLLFDLSQITFKVHLGEPEKSSGYCLKLNYNDEFDLVCNNTLDKYTSNYEFIRGKDIYSPKEFKDLILKYQGKEGVCFK